MKNNDKDSTDSTQTKTIQQNNQNKALNDKPRFNSHSNKLQKQVDKNVKNNKLGPVVKFGTLTVAQSTGRALDDMNYQQPTPIQKRVIPIIQDGRDIVGQAQTGTGKTAAFGIPIIELIHRKSNGPQALVLVPTRELALQVKNEISSIGKYKNITAIAVYGGQSLQSQITSLKQGVDIIIATPGRLMDHIQRGTIKLNRIKIAVLDEADQMLDIGFIEDIEYILRQTPRHRQTLLFSATIPYPIRRLANRYLKNPNWIKEGKESEPVDEVDQIYYEVAAQDRFIALEEILNKDVTQALLFCRTKSAVDYLVKILRNNTHDAQGIHSDMTQAQREKVMRKFRSKKLKLLVATNVASRGLDIPAVSHVINFDMPDNIEDYLHRIGRTARMGRKGIAITFVSDLQDFNLLDTLQEHLNNGLKQQPLSVLYN